MKAKNNFYEELIRNDYYSEKLASDSNDDIGTMLDAFSTEEMEALAEELNIAYEKRASNSPTTEDKIVGATDLTDERDTHISEESETNKTKNEVEGIVNPEAKKIEEKVAGNKNEDDLEESSRQNAEATRGATGMTDERDTHTSEESETGKTNKEVDDMVNPEAKDVEEKVADYEMDELIKVAYEVAEEKLANEGYSLVDYVYTKVPNEKVAFFIADNAEKLAYLSEKSPLQVADDIIVNMDEVINRL